MQTPPTEVMQCSENRGSSWEETSGASGNYQIMLRDGEGSGGRVGLLGQGLFHLV